MTLIQVFCEVKNVRKIFDSKKTLQSQKVRNMGTLQ